MALYKYCKESGKFIFQNLEIKVTPPNELNDPCEMKPVVRNDDPKGWARRFLKKAVTEPSYYYNANAHEHPNCRNFREFQKFARANLANMTLQLEQMPPTLHSDLQKEMQDAVSKKWGVISLSANPVQHLMWAHYADSHRGMVVEFDESNKLFDRSSFLKCEYSNTPASYDYSQGPNFAAVNEIARRKRTDWSYEEESRLIVPLVGCRCIMKRGSPIYLLPVEPQVITSITFGLRTPNALRQELLATVGRPELRHVTKWQIVELAKPGDFERVRFP